MVPLFGPLPSGNGLLVALLVNLVVAGLAGVLVRAHADRRGFHGPAWSVFVALATLSGSLVGLTLGLGVYGVRLFLRWYDPTALP